jgi:hypothetical protein
VVCARTNIEERIEEFCDAAGIVESKAMMHSFVASMPDKVAWAAR